MLLGVARGMLIELEVLMKTWTFNVETVRDGAVIATVRRTVSTLGGVTSPWGPAPADTLDNAFDALNLPAAELSAKEYQRATLIRGAE